SHLRNEQRGCAIPDDVDELVRAMAWVQPDEDRAQPRAREEYDDLLPAWRGHHCQPLSALKTSRDEGGGASLNYGIKLPIREPMVGFDERHAVRPACCLATHEIPDALDGWSGRPMSHKGTSRRRLVGSAHQKRHGVAAGPESSSEIRSTEA